MRNRSSFLSALALLTALAGCGGEEDHGPVAVDMIGPEPTIVDPNRKPLSAPAAALLSATAQGLVRFDAAGQIEPGLAIRWDVSDDGLYYTFRLASGLAIDADDAARRLRAAIAPSSRNPLKPLFGGVDEIVAVTPEVIEIRLVSPQPNLLELLAQPQMALLANGAGTGPFETDTQQPGALTLDLVTPPDADPLPPEKRPPPTQLRAERAALGVARFKAGTADLVLGGTFADLPIAKVAGLPARALRFDPVSGLFGLAVVEPKAFLASAENRRALALSIDRARIAAAFPDSGWRTAESLVAPNTVELGSGRPIAWADLSPALRRQIAAGTVRIWARGTGAPPRLRVAMPPGPGSRLLFTLLAAGWRDIGVETVLVEQDADADLRLIDAVAPTDGAAWYLHSFSCTASPACDPRADEALKAADKAATGTERAARLAEAEAVLAEALPFLPIAQPVRWSLVSQRLDGFQVNARAAHPLNHLLRPKR